MITQLATVKARLAIDVFDVKYDDLLTNAIKAVGTRFEKICNRTFARTVSALHEFEPCETELVPACYPIESVSKFELKSTEAEGWIEQTGVDYVIRHGCVISLSQDLSLETSDLRLALARVTYTGGYVLPGTTPGAGQTALPDDLEQAAVEQVASWFLNRDKSGLIRRWPKGGIYEQFVQTELLPAVTEVLKGYVRVG